MQAGSKQQGAALIARAKAWMAELCLKLKRLFYSTKQSQAAECLLLLEYQPAQNQSELVPVELPVEASVCNHKHGKHKYNKKEPCPHCGRPFGKQPEEITEQYLREKREKRRLAREAAKKRKEETGVSLVEEKIKKSPKIDEITIAKAKPYNVRCPKCKRLIKQPFDVVGDDHYQSAQKKISDALQQEFAQPAGQLATLIAKRQHNHAWLLTLAVPYLKAADASLRDKPAYSNGQPIVIVVPWQPAPPHFIAPKEDDWRGWAELRDYKRKERRLKAQAKRHQAKQEAGREVAKRILKRMQENTPPENLPPNRPFIRLI